MKALCGGLSILLCLLLAAPAAAGTLKLEIRNGRVTLEARDVSVREILAEWARVGRTRIENREQVGGGPVTLTLNDVPEREALDILLRSVTGYIAAPRSTPLADASTYEVVYVLAAVRPAVAKGAGAAQGLPQQQLMRGGRGQMSGPGVGSRPNQPADDVVDEVLPPVMRPGFVMEQMPYPDATGATQMRVVVAPGGAAPGMTAAPAQPTQGQPPSYTTLPGQATTPGTSATPGAATGGTPTGTTSIPGVVPPGASSTTAKPIKPPGDPNETR